MLKEVIVYFSINRILDRFLDRPSLTDIVFNKINKLIIIRFVRKAGNIMKNLAYI